MPLQTLDQENYSQITNLCQKFSSVSGHAALLGSLRGEGGFYFLRAVGDPNKFTKDSSVTPDDLLCATPPVGRRQRYRLALIIASSYHQLGRIPWLRFYALKKDIAFPFGWTGPDAACPSTLT